MVRRVPDWRWRAGGQTEVRMSCGLASETGDPNGIIPRMERGLHENGPAGAGLVVGWRWRAGGQTEVRMSCGLASETDDPNGIRTRVNYVGKCLKKVLA